MFKEYLILDCPFCKRGQISVTYYPSFKKFRKGPWGGSRVGVRKSADDFIINSPRCPVCGKTSEELMKEFKKQGIV
jgi:transposase-like protein